MRQKHRKIWLQLHNTVESTVSLEISLFSGSILKIIFSTTNQISHVGDPVLSL